MTAAANFGAEIRVPRESKPEIEVPRPVLFGLGEGEELSSGAIVRLSVAGAEVECSESPSEGREVFLTAELIDGEGDVVMHGRVQWSKPGRFAVRFEPLGTRTTMAIAHASRRS